MMRPVLALAVVVMWAVGLWRRLPLAWLVVLTAAVAALYLLRHRLRDARWRRNQEALLRIFSHDAVATGGAAGERLAQALAARGTVPTSPGQSPPPWVQPLLEVPIFVLVGPPEAGASTLLQHAGVRWHGREIGPVWGATWWVADGCLVARPQPAGAAAPAGPGGTGGTAPAGQVGDWPAFAAALRRLRPRASVQGILMAVDVAPLVAGGPQVRRLGQELRAEVVALQDNLAAQLPIYGLVTRCDALPGFTALFGRATAAQRQGLCGEVFALPWPATGGEAQARVAALLGRLVQQTAQASWGLMQGTSDLRQREQMYRLPVHLEALRLGVATFTEAFFGAGPAPPALRALLFTAAQPARVTGLHAALPGQSTQVAHGAYFTQQLVERGLMPDVPLDLAWRRDRPPPPVRSLMAALGLALLAVPWLAWSEGRDELALAAAAVAAASASAGDDPPPPPETLLALDELASRWQREHPAAGAASWPLRPAAELAEPLARARDQLLLSQVVRPLLGQERQATAAMPAAAGPGGGAAVVQIWEALRLQVAAATPAPATAGGGGDVAWLGEALAGRWARAQLSDDPGTLGAMTLLCGRWATAAARDPALRAPEAREWLIRARDFLGAQSPESLWLARLTDGADPYGLAFGDLVGEPPGFAGVRAHIVGGFTREGYERLVRPRLDRAGADMQDWQAAGPQVAQAMHAFAEGTGAEALELIYWRHYADAWRRFLGALPTAEVAAVTAPAPPPAVAAAPAPPAAAVGGDHVAAAAPAADQEAAPEARSAGDPRAQPAPRQPSEALLRMLTPLHHQRLERAWEFNLEPARGQVDVPHLADAGL